ncbi:MAG: acetyl/propionyl-CoA carboxylase subunit alpha [Solirubrobacteraceae bacterium]|nr:acetyl/propionyl-CoA carboxylase subunit alpha [Solirubrobacteraceae bacterium]
MPDRVLIANRGEIAVRIAATLRRLGIESVAVHAPQDAAAPHVAACDHAVALPADEQRSPYLDVDRLVAIARERGCDAVHPGYGFLAERADAARAFVDAGIAWIGPTADAIDLLGDKIASKRTAADADVPVVPGLQGDDVTAEQVRAFADDAGLPLLLKASAGGGGKGMRRVDALAELDGAVGAARREAQAAFGRAELLVERLVEPARHVEVQIAADHHGAVVAIGERECSLQRRHQKLVEESPAPGLGDVLRTRLHEAAVRLATAAGYRNLGTVEFLVGVPDARPGSACDDDATELFFLEMNARLQVEHPVTELVHGLDLVELQLRITDGEPLADAMVASRTDDRGGAGAPRPRGHAIEARICAERIGAGPAGPVFLPATGPVVAYAEPHGPGIRVDSGLAAGGDVTTAFDPMLLKVVAHGRDRDQALERLRRALDELTILGVQTNAAFLRRLVDRPEVRAGAQTTTLVEALLADEDDAAGLAGPSDAAAAAALRALTAWRRHEEAVRTGDGRTAAFDRPDGWRIGGPASTRLRMLDPDDAAVTVDLRPRADGGSDVAVDGADPVAVGVTGALGPDGVARIEVREGHDAARWTVGRDDDWWWVHGPDGTWSWRDMPETTAGTGVGSGSLEAPLPGVVIAVRAAVGDAVTAGTVIVVLESMKMELEVVAPTDGVVGEVDVAVGDHVKRGQVLAAVQEEESA